MSVHESNLINIIKTFINNIKLIKYDYPEQDTIIHVQRKEYIDKIMHTFTNYAQRYKEYPDSHIILRWFYTQKLLDTTNIDPLLPYNEEINEGLHYELLKYRALSEDVTEISTIIYNMIKKFKPITSSESSGLTNVELVQDGEDYTLFRGTLKFRLFKSTYQKLSILYNGESDKFITRMFNLFCRYYSLSSPGYHAAIPPSLFNTLKSHLQVNHEIFASPFNCNLDIGSYTSAYPDTDKYFGSKGNFFGVHKDLFKNGGSFEANPPFLEEYMIALTFIIIRELKENNNPLSFVIVYPTWSDSISYKLLIESQFNVLKQKVLVFNENEHHYTQSSQYWIKIGSDKISTSKSSIFILQNDAGEVKYRITDETINKIKENFKIKDL